MTPNNDNKLFEEIRHAAEQKTALGKQAEEQVRNMEPVSQTAQTPEESQRMLHELRVHQIELEMRREELRMARAEIDAWRARYFDLYDLAPVGYCTVSEQGSILQANLPAATLLGRAGSALLKRPLSHFIVKEDQDIYYQHRKRLFETGETQECELRLVKPDGTNFWARLTAAAAQAEDGTPVCRIVLGDITGRTQAEEALKASEMRFKELLRNVPTVAVQGYALDGTVCYWNRASETFYGYTEEEALAQNLLDLIIPPAMHDGVRAAMRGMVETHETPPASELELMRKDGSLIAVYSSHALVQLPGKEPELFCIDIDLTERKRVQEANRESETKFRTLVEASSSGIWRTDAAGYNTYVSPRWCEIAGMPEPAAAGQGWASGLYPDDRISILTGWEKAAAASLPYSAEFRFVHPDGRIVWVLCQASPVMAGGHIAEWIGTITDITGIKDAESEREALQAELTQAHKMESVGRLAGGVAHDFNNMLGIILGHTELAMARVEPGDPLHADLAEIRMAAQRSADLTRQILAFARKQTIAPKVLDLNDTVEGTLKMLRRLIGEEIDLEWKPGPGLWPVRMDPTQIDQILANLCINARDAISGVGKITVSTRNTALDEKYCARHGGGTPGEYVMLNVSDDGCGMDSETLLLIFDPFYTTKEIGKGTGLGLATVYGIVKQNHGFINASSKLGQGATFTIHLPRHAAGMAPLPGNAPDQAVSSGHETILLVEDEPALLKMATIVMERLGYTVLAAGSPAEAIRLAREHAGRIDLLLTDVVMPGMNGRDLAKSLLSACPGLKRLFMSGYTADIIARHGVMDDGEHFIHKPFSLKDLAKKLREVLEE